jgi:hypothetical protein
MREHKYVLSERVFLTQEHEAYLLEEYSQLTNGAYILRRSADGKTIEELAAEAVKEGIEIELPGRITTIAPTLDLDDRSPRVPVGISTIVRFHTIYSEKWQASKKKAAV